MAPRPTRAPLPVVGRGGGYHYMLGPGSTPAPGRAEKGDFVSQLRLMYPPLKFSPTSNPSFHLF